MTEFIPAHPPLLECAVEAERYVAASGWDQPIRLFALVERSRFDAAEPGLADTLHDHGPSADAEGGPGAGRGGNEIDGTAGVGATDTSDTDDIDVTDDTDPLSYVTIEQEDLPEHEDVEALLAQIAWPPEVDGVAVAIERIVLPPEAETDLPDDPDALRRALAEHPQRADIRLLAAVLRNGDRVCLVRQRAHDSDDKVASGQEIAPGLLDALATTLED